MKNKIFFLILAALVFFGATYSASAQSTAPRWGTAKNEDNTGRVLTFKKATFTDAAGDDSVYIKPSASVTYVTATIADSSAVFLTPLTSSYFGDEVRFIFEADASSGNKVEFDTGNIELATAGKITLTANKRAIVVFMFDGEKWVEAYRMVQ